MRILKNVILDGKPVHFADERLVLELSNSGRGFVTVETTAPCVGKLVEFELGTEENYYTWFTGFVENEHAAQNGYKRLFIRERGQSLNGIFTILHAIARWLMFVLN